MRLKCKLNRQIEKTKTFCLRKNYFRLVRKTNNVDLIQSRVKPTVAH